mmetsp:Transcript_3686/g.10599  ORF Transcript_3686/g.10599 Transcript_3686/m.10599 type:complete len:220 (+) Transcript_3686:602-1261(+)
MSADISIAMGTLHPPPWLPLPLQAPPHLHPLQVQHQAPRKGQPPAPAPHPLPPRAPPLPQLQPRHPPLHNLLPQPLQLPQRLLAQQSLLFQQQMPPHLSLLRHLPPLQRSQFRLESLTTRRPRSRTLPLSNPQAVRPVLTACCSSMSLTLPLLLESLRSVFWQRQAGNQMGPALLTPQSPLGRSAVHRPSFSSFLFAPRKSTHLSRKVPSRASARCKSQ